MSDNHLKTPLAKSLPQAIRKGTENARQLTGKALAASVTAVVSSNIVTVKFEVNAAPFTLPEVTMPLMGPEYIRYPIQVGDKGFCVPADVRLGGVSGLGGGTPSLNQPANLAALVFFPIGNRDWSEVDLNQLVMYGPGGVVIRDTDGESVITLTPTAITMVRGSAQVSMSDTALSMVLGGASVELEGGNVNINGTLYINGDPYLSHVHTNGNMGGNTGGVVP